MSRFTTGLKMALASTALAAAPTIAQQPLPPRPGAVQPESGEAIAAQEARFDQWRATLPQGTGPYAVSRLEPAGLPGFTVFQPRDITRVRGTLPLLVFASGGCRNTPIEFTPFLSEIASRGYVIVAVGRSDVPFLMLTSTVQNGTARNGEPLRRTEQDVLSKAIDAALAENAKRGGVFGGRLDAQRIAAVGQSCGGLQSLAAARDLRVRTALALNSGAFPTAPANGRKVITSAELANVRVPIAYFIGGPTDVGYLAAKSNIAAIAHAPVLFANLPVGHTGAYPNADRRWSKAVVAWLDWQLKGDAAAGRTFTGADCGLCRDPEWTVERKNLP